MIDKKDTAQIKSHGISMDDFNREISLLKEGVEPAELIRPAQIGDGIVRLSDREKKALNETWKKKAGHYSLSKFVPASGAATRMFKEFFAYLDGGPETKDVQRFFNNLSGFAFSDDLPPLSSDKREDKEALLRHLLTEDGFNFGALPKGLLPFHLRDGEKITPFEEHLTEGALAATSKTVKVHFTVSPQHKELFEALQSSVVPKLEKKFDVSYQVEYSFQSPSTDTPALDEREEPFRLEDGSLLFRPGGHGSLIKNLNGLNDDIIFLKNIDNVGALKYGELSVQWFSHFGALLIEAREALSQAEKLISTDGSEKNIKTAKEALGQWGGIEVTSDCSVKDIITLLNRPVRVAGMVVNEGDAGGGPFWIVDGQGNHTLQIVESAQIDSSRSGVAEKLEGITHFNPVFVACSPKNCQGKKIDLTKHVDQSAAFTAEKSLNGKPLKALEHPGLWNGSMAFWNTTFVEIPAECFNPVKSLPDLLGSAHKE